MVLSKSDDLFFTLCHDLIEIELEVFCPFWNWQLVNYYRVILALINIAISEDLICTKVSIRINLSIEVLVPWMDDWELLTFEFPLDNVTNLSWIEVGNESRPTSSDTLTSIDQNHRNNRHIVFRLNNLPVIFNIRQWVIVWLGEEQPCYSVQAGENVSCRGVIFAS